MIKVPHWKNGFIGLLLGVTLQSCMMGQQLCPCSATDTVVVDDVRLTFDAEVVKSFTPDDQSLHVRCQVSTLEGKALPENLRAELFLMKPIDEFKEGVQGTFIDASRDEMSGVMQLTALTESDYNVGEELEVVVLLVDKNGDKQFIKQAHVSVELSLD